MKRDSVLIFAILSIISFSFLNAQTKQNDKAVFVESKNDFYENMQKEINSFNKKENSPRKSFKVDVSKMDLPKSEKEFTQYFHFEPISQGMTGTCWCFSTTSYFESEIYRQTKRKINLSELYTVYWEYVEKAKRFVKERGNSEFGEGSEANAVRRIWEVYGVVPDESYNGMKQGQKFHDHGKLYEEMYNYLKSVKANNEWDENKVVSTIKSILNHYLGEPPTTLKVDGKNLTPQEYLQSVVKLNLNDYIDVISLMEAPYYTQIEYKVPDNWWHDASYYNVPLDEFMQIYKSAIRNGYTIVMGGDVSEPGIVADADVAIVPSFDIPSENIDENARQYRFTNGTTTDDHGIHTVGYLEKNGKDWYLVKDSGAGAMNGNSVGYYFYNEDYVKLKMVDFMVHKDAMKDILKKFEVKE